MQKYWLMVKRVLGIIIMVKVKMHYSNQSNALTAQNLTNQIASSVSNAGWY